MATLQKSSNCFTTIIGGKFRGKKLALPPVATTRSSKSRLKESYFNTLQFDIVDAKFVEMFAGSGSVGLEALSRGASCVYFCEKNKTALQTLKKNIAITQPQNCVVYAGDSFENIQKIVTQLQQEKSSAYFYIDPPFDIREGMEDIYQKVLQTVQNLPKEVVKMITIEHSSSVGFDTLIGEYELLKSKKFGKTTLSYYS